MAAQSRLNAYLVTSPGAQANFQKRCAGERFQHAIFTDGLLSLWILWMCFLLNEGVLVPDERVAPDARRWVGGAVDDRPVHTSRLATSELILQHTLRFGVFGKHHDA